jgi:hypothetical protein
VKSSTVGTPSTKLIDCVGFTVGVFNGFGEFEIVCSTDSGADPHNNVHLIDLFDLSVPSIIGATAYNLTHAAKGHSAVLMNPV